MHPASRWPSLFLSLLLVFTHSADAFFHRPLRPTLPPPPRQLLLFGQTPVKHVCDGSEPNTGVAYFDQLLDHSVKQSKCKLSLPRRTFKQRYFWSNESWGGPGYPVIVMSSGEGSLDGFCSFLHPPSLLAKIAERVRAAILVIEHRYYGESSPFQRLTTQTLQQLTLYNAIHDLTYFARNVKLPFDPTANTSKLSNAPNSPWILSGGSYPGALSAWTASLDPGTFWGYHASSAPVQAVYDFWQYFEPIRAGMPPNCSRGLADITAYIDHATMTLPPTELAALKDEWGLGVVTDPADFASVASFFKDKILPGLCYERYGYKEFAPNNNTDSPIATCLNSFNSSSIIYTDRAVNNSMNVQWSWMLCNEPFGWWQTGQTPPGLPAISSRLMTPEYFQRQCDVMFGPNSAEFKANGGGPFAGGDGIASASINSATSNTYGSATGKTAEMLNDWTSGWEFNTRRILWVNGEFDPWRPASVSSTFRPGGPLESTPDAPVIIIKGGRHCEDFFARSNNTYLANVVEQEVSYIAGFVDEFYDANTKPGQNRTLSRLLPMRE
ncbi:hypothetical protein Sste5346_008049 [Sporothrix stenoceras]|uniref:Serine peptidase n=1 Tax=Sporothrix stenoceras TaxID=5173 RepID=A0ABR3YQV1_9PEZI